MSDSASRFVTTDAPVERRPVSETEPQTHGYVGMWVTDNGDIRHELLDNGRYDEARGDRESAYQGRYRSTGTSSATGTTPASTLTAASPTTRHFTTPE